MAGLEVSRGSVLPVSAHRRSVAHSDGPERAEWSFDELGAGHEVGGV